MRINTIIFSLNDAIITEILSIMWDAGAWMMTEWLQKQSRGRCGGSDRESDRYRRKKREEERQFKEEKEGK